MNLELSSPTNEETPAAVNETAPIEGSGSETTESSEQGEGVSVLEEVTVDTAMQVEPARGVLAKTCDYALSASSQFLLFLCGRRRTHNKN